MLLAAQLKRAAPVTVVPRSSVDFAVQELGLDADRQPTPKQLQTMGKITGARFLLYTRYSKTGNKWSFTASVIETENAEQSTTITATSQSWPEILQNVSLFARKRFGVPVDEQESPRPASVDTNCVEALALASAAFPETPGGLSPQAEATLRLALSLDPGCVWARQGLAWVLMVSGRLDEAAKVASEAIQSSFRHAPLHTILAYVHLFRGETTSAEAELHQAVRLDPDEARNYAKLAEICASEAREEEALQMVSAAEHLAPFDPLIRADLCQTYYLLGARTNALNELQFAERYDLGSDAGVYRALAACFAQLGDIPKALQYQDKFLASATKAEIQSPMVEEARRTAEDLKARLKPFFLQQTLPPERPPATSLQMLKDAARRDHLPLVNPFALTPDMASWADHVAGGKADELCKARALFEEISMHLNRKSRAHTLLVRTAAEAFPDLFDPCKPLSCSDVTLLYVSLARHLGLRASWVHVAQDFAGRNTLHACPGVEVQGKTLLVDPSYSWFGVPHQKYEFEEDLRVISLVLAYSGDPSRAALALKLAPDWALLHFLVALDQVPPLSLPALRWQKLGVRPMKINVTRAERKKLKASQSTADAGLKIDPDSWVGLYAEALLDIALRSDWDSAALHLDECLSHNLMDDRIAAHAHFLLGTALLCKGLMSDARTHYNASLAALSNPEQIAFARSAVLKLDEKLGEQNMRTDPGPGNKSLKR